MSGSRRRSCPVRRPERNETVRRESPKQPRVAVSRRESDCRSTRFRGPIARFRRSIGSVSRTSGRETDLTFVQSTAAPTEGIIGPNVPRIHLRTDHGGKTASRRQCDRNPVGGRHFLPETFIIPAIHLGIHTVAEGRHDIVPVTEKRKIERHILECVAAHDADEPSVAATARHADIAADLPNNGRVSSQTVGTCFRKSKHSGFSRYLVGLSESICNGLS